MIYSGTNTVNILFTIFSISVFCSCDVILSSVVFFSLLKLFFLLILYFISFFRCQVTPKYKEFMKFQVRRGREEQKGNVSVEKRLKCD